MRISTRAFYVAAADKAVAERLGYRLNALGGCTVGWGEALYEAWTGARSIASWGARDEPVLP